MDFLHKNPLQCIKFCSGEFFALFVCSLRLNVDHFPIVLSLARSALQTGEEVIRGQVERLVRALEQTETSAQQASQLKKLLSQHAKSAELTPSRVVLSKAQLGGERLSRSVQVPVDKETAAPLASISFPGEQNLSVPIFSKDLNIAVQKVIEEWTYVDELKNAGLTPALTTMFFGLPGTGKTMLAHYISEKLNLPLVTAKLDGLVSSFLGTTARNISALFSFADRYQCILLLDEFDAIAKVRDDPQELGEIKRVVNTLLQCIDERSQSGFTIAITNHENLLDSAIWRRFDIRIHVPLPGLDARQSIFEKYLNKICNERQIIFLAWVMEGCSGSDVEKLSIFLLRQHAINSKDFEFFDVLRLYAQLSAINKAGLKKDILLLPVEKIAVALLSDVNNPFNQEQIAYLFGKTQSTISRWVNKEKFREV